MNIEQSPAISHGRIQYRVRLTVALAVDPPCIVALQIASPASTFPDYRILDEQIRSGQNTQFATEGLLFGTQ
jgi:hypothetical protein